MTVRLYIITKNTSFSTALKAFVPVLAEQTGFHIELVGLSSEAGPAQAEIAVFQPHLILCDLGQPDGAIDGLAVSRWASQQRTTNLQDAPQVIVCSLYPDEMFEQASCDAGAAAFLVKDQLARQLPILLREIFHSPMLAQ